MLLATKVYVIPATIALTQDDDEYELDTALSTDPLAVNSIVNSDGTPLERVSVEEIHDLRRGTGSTAGTNTYKYALDGANLLLLYPTPGASPGDLTAYYVPKPTEMSSGAHDPATATYGGIPAEFHDAVEWYALWRLSTYDDDVSSQQGLLYKQWYDEEIAKIRRWVRSRGGRKLGPARLARRGRLSNDPSAGWR